jgi:hypothetical protein
MLYDSARRVYRMAKAKTLLKSELIFFGDKVYIKHGKETLLEGFG